MTRKPTYRLTIRPDPRADDPEGIRRLRRLLKRLLRSYGFRVTLVEPIRDKEQSHD